jgi:endonuclease YncB( thermonuclease family)
MIQDWDWRFIARVLRVVDADTFEIAVDLGFNVDCRVRVRVANVDAPEMSTPQGRAAQLWALTLIGAQPYVVVHTQPARSGDFIRSFERYIATVVLPDGSDYGERLVEAGHATRRTAA